MGLPLNPGNPCTSAQGSTERARKAGETGEGGLDKECTEIERAGPDARAEQWECGLRKENGIFSELKSIARLNP